MLLHPTPYLRRRSPPSLPCALRQRRVRAWRQLIDALVRPALRPMAAQRFVDELEALVALQSLALAAPRTFAALVGPRRRALSGWLFALALEACRVAPDDALVLLDALPGVDAGGGGRRDIVVEVRDRIAEQPARGPVRSVLEEAA